MKTLALACALSMISASALFAQNTPDPGFVPLFDGKTTAGWHNPYEWGEVWVEEGEIRLRADKKFFLLTDKPYGDFVFEGEIFMPEGQANSGFMLRCHEEKNKVYGYQAEVDTSTRAWAGGLYDEGRRGWLNPLKDQPEKQAAFKNGQWNKYRVECVGDQIKISVNGTLTTDYRDPVDIAGPIGIQHHGEKGQIYRFRNLRIKDLGRREWQSLWSGMNLNGLTLIDGGGKWTLKDGAIVGTSDKANTHHTLLISDKSFKDFTIRLKFKAVKGNSGFFFRVERANPPVGIKGLQAEIDPDKDTGGLHEAKGRGWVVQPKPEDVKKWYKPNAWNDMAVSAHGKRIVVHVNGFKTAEVLDDPGRAEGPIALQLHGGQDVEVMFKEIEILGEPK